MKNGKHGVTLTVFNSDLSKPRHANNVRNLVGCKTEFTVLIIVPCCRVQSVHQCGLSVGVKIFTTSNLHFEKKMMKKEWQAMFTEYRSAFRTRLIQSFTSLKYPSREVVVGKQLPYKHYPSPQRESILSATKLEGLGKTTRARVDRMSL